MAEPRTQGALSPEPGGLAPAARDPLSWVQERWVVLAGLALFLLVVWLASGKSRPENGRYTLVKDDVPCQSLTGGEGDERRWCYLVLDTRTGQLEERTRKLERRGAR